MQHTHASLLAHNMLEHHDWRLLALAASVCLFCCFVALRLFQQSKTRRDDHGSIWLGAAAFVAGSGIWTTHFIAMLAYKTDLAVGYDLELTALSIVVAVVMSWVGFFVVKTWGQSIVGGSIIGVGIAAMHYTGMSALLVPASKLWDPQTIATSIAIGTSLAALALHMDSANDTTRRRLLAAAILTVSICAMHLTGMAALTLKPDPTVVLPPEMLAPEFLVAVIAAVATLIAAIGLVSSIVSERTAHRRADLAAKLAESERRTMRFIALMQDLLMVVDARGQISTINPRSLAFFGVEPGRLVGRLLVDFIAAKDSARVATILRDVRLGKPTAQFEASIRGPKDEEIPLLWSVTYSQTDQTLMIVAQDLRARVAMEKRALRYRKLEALAAFTGGFAHEFSSLATVILGESESLRDAPALELRQRERARLIFDTASRATNLTASLLAFARKTQAEAGIIDADRGVKRACDLLQRFVAGICVELDLDAHGALISFDQDRLASVLSDLFKNARDAIGDRPGTIKVATRYEKAGASVTISVSDNGVGMDNDALERAMDPFFTTKAPGKGVGLGLSNVHGLIVSAGGTVTIQSTRQTGTTVNIVLPLCDDDTAVALDLLDAGNFLPEQKQSASVASRKA